MVLAARLGIIPVIIIIAVAFTVVVWLVNFFAGIRKTNEFYRRKMKEAETEEEPDSDGRKLSDQDIGSSEKKHNK
ncbi:MAG: hypothetical protein IKG70_09230 [Lachnospiraceae bacterium]|nr:hypothetical protein [Lachnospiraceae bacterium]